MLAHAALNVDWLGQPRGYAGLSVEGFTDLDIVYPGAGRGDAQLRLANGQDAPPPHDTAYSLFPSAFAEAGDVWFERAGVNPEAGNYDYLTIIHELGHTLGLKHPHEAGGFGTLPKAKDSLEFTVMTYRTYVGDDLAGLNAETWGHPQSYMMYDIAALQHLYGADFSTNAGDTTYRWDPDDGSTFVNGELAINPGDNRIFLTVWDGGGNDLYDFSAYAADLKVDLAPGGFSVLDRNQLADLGGGPNGGHARGSVFNALQYKADPRSLIEAATGGSGDDVIKGNAAGNALSGNGGDDQLSGFDGGDWLKGGAGSDALRGGAGSDRLCGGAGADVLVGGRADDEFTFLEAASSSPGSVDVIRGGDGAPAFDGIGRKAGDLIDLSGIDGDLQTEGHQSLVFGGAGSGHVILRDSGKDTLLCFDNSGDGILDFELRIEDGAQQSAGYAASDLIL
jgi:serralysin